MNPEAGCNSPLLKATGNLKFSCFFVGKRGRFGTDCCFLTPEAPYLSLEPLAGMPGSDGIYYAYYYNACFSWVIRTSS